MLDCEERLCEYMLQSVSIVDTASPDFSSCSERESVVPISTSTGMISSLPSFADVIVSWKHNDSLLVDVHEKIFLYICGNMLSRNNCVGPILTRVII